MNITLFDLDRRVKEVHLPEIHPPEYYQHEKSKKHRRKRRAFYPPCMPEIRIMKHDIRRRYGEMLVNVSNNQEILLVRKFFGEYFRPDCPVIKITTNHAVHKNIDLVLFDGVSRETISINEYLDCFDASFKMIPNQIIRLLESQVRIRQGYQGSIVLLKVLIKGVKQFAAYPLNEREDGFCHSSSSTSQTSSPLSRSSSDDTNSPLSSMPVEAANSSSMEEDWSTINKNKGSKYYLDVAPVPLETVTMAAIMMVLDENHFIRELHVEYRCVSETPYSGMN